MAVTTEQTTENPAKSEGAQDVNLPSATGIDTSGAPQQIVPDADMNHPAVDANPRAGTTTDQNRIDFNDPRASRSDAVADALNAQGVPTKTGAEAARSLKRAK